MRQHYQADIDGFPNQQGGGGSPTQICGQHVPSSINIYSDYKHLLQLSIRLVHVMGLLLSAWLLTVHQLFVRSALPYCDPRVR